MNGYENKNETNTSKAIVRNAIEEKNSNLAVCSLVCGIFGLIGFCVIAWNLVFSIAGIITGGLCIYKKHKNQTMAVVGIIISSIALVLSIIAYIVSALALFAA